LKYSIDTSAILDGWRRYYPPDVLPDVWTGFDDLIKKGHLVATEEVLVELEKRDDEVHKWAKKRKKMFLPIDDPVQLAVSSILAAHEKLVDTRTNRSAADPFVIGLGLVHGCTVVTGEKATGSADRPNIPDVCTALGIRSMGLLDLFREEGWRFVRAR
jgi:hypothetical protein